MVSTLPREEQRERWFAGMEFGQRRFRDAQARSITLTIFIRN